MVSRKLMCVWFALDMLLLLAGAGSVALAQVWRAPNVLINMVLSNAELTAGTALGVALIITFLISIVAVMQRNHVTFGLVLLNYALIVDAVGIIIIGTFVWWATLEEGINFHKLWAQTPATARLALQDEFKCCGFFNGSDLAEIGGNFCVSPNFINSLQTDDLNKFCVTPITDFADTMLNHIFTTVYGYMAIILCFLLATLCVIKKRQEDERFWKIDAKRGGQGFV